VISALIAQKLNTKRGVEFNNRLSSKHEAIDLLFWYAVREERGGDTGPFDAILNLTKREPDGSCSHEPLWDLSASKMCTYGSPRAVVLVGPYIHWGREQSADAQGLISKWAAGISVARHTEEVAGSVVDTLLQIAANPHLRPFIPADAWSWLNDLPYQPPTCKGLRYGCDRDIVRTVRALGDIGILTSYLIVIWSGEGRPDNDGFAEMQTSVREDFKGIDMGYHRAKLIQWLDLLDQLPPGLVGVFCRMTGLGDIRDQFRGFKRVLQEVDRKANQILNRMLPALSFSVC